MDKSKAARDIIAHALPLVPFEGWSQQTLGAAALAAGYKKTDVIRVFPGGTIDAVAAYLRQADEAMLEQLADYHLDTMKIRQRIATAIRLKIELFAPHREALRRALALLALPIYAPRALSSLYHTVDAIWHGIGDTSSDFSFYTKRLTLAAVYSATILYWLDDHSTGHEQSWAFLDRRIDNVMAFEKAKQRFKDRFARKIL